MPARTWPAHKALSTCAWWATSRDTPLKIAPGDRVKHTCRRLCEKCGLMAAGSERYLTKIDRELPRPLRYHMPRVRLLKYLTLARHFAKRRRCGKACYFLAKA